MIKVSSQLVVSKGRPKKKLSPINHLVYYCIGNCSAQLRLYISALLMNFTFRFYQQYMIIFNQTLVLVYSKTGA